MVTQIISLFTTVFTAISGWFSTLDTKLGFVSLLMGFFLAYSVVRFIVNPMLKDSIGSDQASGSRRKVK